MDFYPYFSFTLFCVKMEVEGLFMAKSAYIHIPFCKEICSYCDFCKMYYKKEWVDQYLEALLKEVKINPPRERLSTIYIGGGTPSILTIDQLSKLFAIVDQFPREEIYEFTFECNIESIDEEKLKLLYEHGVNRISYGVETFHTKYLNFLNRHHTTSMVESRVAMTKRYIPNINIDFIYALENETVEEVKEDIIAFLKLDVPHISTYSLMIEPNTVLGNQKISQIDDEIDYTMYKVIIDTLQQFGYEHYETSNFSRPGYQSKHNLTYWNNEEYYGYGLGASGYIHSIRYTNTRSLNHYLQGHYRIEEEHLTKRHQMEEEMILGLRKIEGVSQRKFEEKFDLPIKSVFPIQEFIEKGYLEAVDDNIRIKEKYQYLSNEVLVSFIGEE